MHKKKVIHVGFRAPQHLPLSALFMNILDLVPAIKPEVRNRQKFIGTTTSPIVDTLIDFRAGLPPFKHLSRMHAEWVQKYNCA